MLVTLLEMVFSIMNAVQEDAFHLTSFEDYVYAASSVMEVLGFVFGLVAGASGGIGHLGLPLALVSTGVVEDDDTFRAIGFYGTVLQAAGVFVLLIVWLYLVIDWFFWVAIFGGVVLCLPLSCCVCWVLFSTYAEYETMAGRTVLSGWHREIPQWSYLTLPFSPLVIELLESYFLLRNFSLDRLVLVIIDILVVFPGIAWLVVQALLLCFGRRR